MYSKIDLKAEGFYWKKQIKRHHLSKRIRNLLRREIELLDKKDKNRPYKFLSKELGISRKTIWALVNGLAIPSEKLIERIERLESEINL